MQTFFHLRWLYVVFPHIFAASTHRGLSSESIEEIASSKEFRHGVSWIRTRAVGHMYRRRQAFLIGREDAEGRLLHPPAATQEHSTVWSRRQLGLGSWWDAWDIRIGWWSPPALLNLQPKQCKAFVGQGRGASCGTPRLPLHFSVWELKVIK